MTRPARSLRGADPNGESGAATIEFVLLVVALLVPLTYVLLAVLTVERTAYALTQAAREAGRGFLTSPDGTDPSARARAAADLALRDQGVDPALVQLAIECTADPCLTPSARVTVRVSTTVDLPWVPEVLGRPAAAIPVSAEHAETVDPFTAVRP